MHWNLAHLLLTFGLVDVLCKPLDLGRIILYLLGYEVHYLDCQLKLGLHRRVKDVPWAKVMALDSIINGWIEPLYKMPRFKNREGEYYE